MPEPEVSASSTSKEFVASAESDIEVPTFDDHDWASEHSPALVEYVRRRQHNCHGRLKRPEVGMHIDVDGRVWTHVDPGRSRPIVKCDEETKRASPDARNRCRYPNSKLAARISPKMLRELKKVLARARYTRHVGFFADAYDETLIATGEGRRDGSTLLVAGCSDGGASHLDSPEGRFIIELFRRLRHAAKLEDPCRSWRDRDVVEVAPGMRAWWLGSTSR